ncbi:MAG: hypothetical protein HRU40_02960 [Saprospiraceae bacterium]|nr:hypothetical protein [Saprospiraceae bacterium]
MKKPQMITLEQLHDYLKCNYGIKSWLDPWGKSNYVFIFRNTNSNGVPIKIREFTLEDGWFEKLKKTDLFKKIKGI